MAKNNIAANRPHFSEINRLKKENEQLKTEIALLKEENQLQFEKIADLTQQLSDASE